MLLLGPQPRPSQSAALGVGLGTRHFYCSQQTYRAVGEENTQLPSASPWSKSGDQSLLQFEGATQPLWTIR